MYVPSSKRLKLSPLNPSALHTWLSFDEFVPYNLLSRCNPGVVPTLFLEVFELVLWMKN